MTLLASEAPPAVGGIVRVRSRRYLVEGVETLIRSRHFAAELRAQFDAIAVPARRR